MKVPPAHQSTQAPTGTDSASCFCKKVQIPQFLSNLDKNKLTSVHCQKLGGLGGVAIAAFINGEGQHSAKPCDLGMYLECLKKDFNCATTYLSITTALGSTGC